MLLKLFAPASNARNRVHHRHKRKFYRRQRVQRIMHLEMARCDRNNGHFAVIVFEVPSDRLQAFKSILLHRTRMTDTVGWFDQTSICAVLPETNLGGALCFARSICQFAAQKAIFFKYQVHTYPAEGFDDDRSGGIGLSRRERASLAEPVEQEEFATAQPLEQMTVHPTPKWKRAIDVIGASAGLVVLSPVMGAAALAVWLSSGRPIMFSQQRAGLGGQPFQIYKFRTMVVDAERRKRELRAMSEQDGPAFKMKSDPRVTRLGKFLRKTSIDELPQLWNVLKGDMSLVGPRPLPVEEVANCERWHRRRHDVAPGITCIWQVHGRSSVTFSEWMRMDRDYIHRRKLWFDLALLFMTFPAVLKGRGAR